MNERMSYAGDDDSVTQRPVYASDDEDESENDAAAERPLPENQNHLVEDTEDESSENDDEMMNPYVMNPSLQSVNERIRNLDSAALLPPSVELANVKTTKRRQPQSFHEDSQLDEFDPYSPTRKLGREVADEMQLEMEEESIDFMTPTPMKNSSSHNKQKFTIFGPLVHEQQSQKEREEAGFEDSESPFTHSSSFSPVFTKHQMTHRQTRYSNSHAGEAMPLSGNPSGARQRKHQYHDQGIPGTIKALGVDILMWIGGGHGHRSPFSHTSHRRQYKHPWLAYFRLFVVMLAAIFAFSTMSMMRHMLFNEIDTSSTVVKYQEGAEEEKSARSNGNLDYLVLKEIKNARLKAMKRKQHWWGRKKGSDVDVESGEKGTSNNVEVYLNGEKDGAVKVESASEEGKSDNQEPAAPVNDKDAFQGVIVETAEDGTLLIKLPPPKMNLEQPSASKGSPQGGLVAKQVGQQDETVLIKLPYPEQRRTLSEKLDSSRSLKFSPLPFMEHKEKHHDHDLSVLQSLRSEFDSWTSQHKKSYSSHTEKEHRFQIWRSSHHRIQKKNRVHGPCRLTGKAVFGHGPFSDLSPDEFREKYLTGYHGPKFQAKASQAMRGTPSSPETSGHMTPPPVASLKRHPDIQRKLEDHVSGKYNGSFVSGCRSWVDVSCMLRKIFGYSYMGGTLEPVYDEDSYPSAIDWRALGIVSSVHSQQSCGACWAITATETIESAYAISTGKLVNLAEEEIIACDGTCEMCNGGWPQNAYEYVMKHKGLPKSSSKYDADFLLTLTSAIYEGSGELSEYETSSYFGQVCPAGSREDGGGGESNSHSSDSQYGTGSSAPRYGNIKGYGYATDRCVCYSDNSGCDCANQNEKTAVLNIASYGPAAVCLEASTWADYSYGIITSASGCTSGFMDMNHCVEVVGYAFTDNGEGNDAHSGDGGKREGYWIVKNQWSTYWGMGGYAYVAMGDNTCGILNDMTQVYMENTMK